jgi:hypothetical protein
VPSLGVEGSLYGEVQRLINATKGLVEVCFKELFLAPNFTFGGDKTMPRLTSTHFITFVQVEYTSEKIDQVLKGAIGIITFVDSIKS